MCESFLHVSGWWLMSHFFVEKTNLVLVFNVLSDDKKVKFRKEITEK